ncbi:MAG: ATP-grasp domain-containing protein [Oscillospiraceae bacterium]|nr:ATP-grasp domain-containing protein [Oscillospiraceae bacterium]
MYSNDGGDMVQNELINELKLLDCEVVPSFDMRDCYCLNGKVYTGDGFDLTKLDVLYHMNADEQNIHQHDILKAIELSGVKVINDTESFFKCKDKFITNFILKNNNINVPEAILIPSNKLSENIKEKLMKFKSFLVKPRDNYGGYGIIKFSDAEQFEDYFLATKNFYSNYYIEKFIDFSDHDHRVEIFNNQIVGSYSRSKKHSFKTNVSSGGTLNSVCIGDEEKDIALKSAKIMGITSTIIDMIKSKENGEFYVLEVNPLLGLFVQACIKSGERNLSKNFFDKNSYNDDVKLQAIVNYIKTICEM